MVVHFILACLFILGSSYACLKPKIHYRDLSFYLQLDFADFSSILNENYLLTFSKIPQLDNDRFKKISRPYFQEIPDSV
jgi:hypothetical protein